jgi:hypothetical protein
MRRSRPTLLKVTRPTPQHTRANPWGRCGTASINGLGTAESGTNADRARPHPLSTVVRSPGVRQIVMSKGGDEQCMRAGDERREAGPSSTRECGTLGSGGASGSSWRCRKWAVLGASCGSLPGCAPHMRPLLYVGTVEARINSTCNPACRRAASVSIGGGGWRAGSRGRIGRGPTGGHRRPA